MRRIGLSLLLLFALLGVRLWVQTAWQGAPAPAGVAKPPPRISTSLLPLLPPSTPPLSPDTADAQGDVRVVVRAFPGDGLRVAERLGALGARVEGVLGDLVQASLAPHLVGRVARWPEVRFVGRPVPPLSPTVVSEGVSLASADVWQAGGFTGEGVRVAVVDLGFAGYQDLLGTELPENVVVRSFRADGDITGGGRSHGTAVAEVVHDVAPGAQLYLVNHETVVELGLAVGWLLAQDIDIIVYSVGWLDGPGDGTGALSDVVRQAWEQGVLWVNSAGNWARRHWLGQWQDSDGDGWLEFANGDEGQSLALSEGDTATVFIRWNDSWGASSNDYDLYLFRGDQVVAYSADTQAGFQDPMEWFTYTVPPGKGGVYEVRIFKQADAQPREVELFSAHQDLEYVVPERSVASPADSPDAIAVGAVPWNAPDTVEEFSSQGPTADGRIKPDLVAYDRVSTSSVEPFVGTSASAPLVAGVSALLKQATGADARVLADWLRQAVVDLAEQGPDNLSGWGRTDLAPVMPTVSGRVVLQGRNTADAVQVTVDGVPVPVEADGSFSGTALPGEAEVVARSPGFLEFRTRLTLQLIQAYQLGTLELRAGDVNGDGRIDTADLQAVLQWLGVPQGDINGDGVTDLRDVVLTARNYGLTIL